MSGYDLGLNSSQFTARATGSLWWEDHSVLIVSDMHLGKSERIARKGGALLPPFETHETLARLADEIAETNPKLVICLGDSFDDLKALDEIGIADHKRLTSLIAGRRWIWIEGNHDAGPVDIGGEHMKEFTIDGITFRHIAEPGKQGEISGHYHPKARVSTSSRPCFLADINRIILPAFGTYTGGLKARDKALANLMHKDAIAVLTGKKAIPVPYSKL